MVGNKCRDHPPLGRWVARIIRVWQGRAEPRGRQQKGGLEEMTAKGKRGRPFGRTVGDRFSVRLPPDLEDRLRRKAEAEDRPAAGIVRQALRQYLGDDPASEPLASGDQEVIAQAS